MIEKIKANIGEIQPIEGRTWEQLPEYLYWRAEKQVKERKGMQCVAIEDEVVYSWARHYFTEENMEQEWIDHINPPKPKEQPRVEEKPASQVEKKVTIKKKHTPKSEEAQMDMFDIWDM